MYIYIRGKQVSKKCGAEIPRWRSNFGAPVKHASWPPRWIKNPEIWCTGNI